MEIGLTGPGNDYKHQIILTYIIYSLMDKFRNTKKYKDYLPFPEFSLKPDNGAIPDITIRKVVHGKPTLPIVLIEVCKTNKVKKDGEKLSDLMKTIPSLKECFVIDKDTLTVFKIGRTSSGKPSTLSNSSKIEYFKFELSKILKDIQI